ncbi:MAG: class I SAM-dependent methyltransferase [Streptomyces sp.]|nr:class I SAM-dependent methyltransferase [Streptomyces sp.]
MTAAESRAQLDSWVRRLASHPQVAAARLVPGAQPRIEVTPKASVTETVDGWLYLFEDLYDSGVDHAGSCDDPQLVGWIDGLTQKPVPVAQMREWVDTTVDRIKSLRPRSVLEIGAGTGLIMGELLTSATLEEYVATDLASASIEVLRSISGRGGPHSRVRVHQGPAHEDPPASEGGGYDTVILNSVAQYFPSVEYLEDVIARAIECMAPQGHLFLGDLRDATLLTSYYQRRSAGTEADFDLERHQRRDLELSLSPDYVKSLEHVFGAVTAVETAPRRGRHLNEMTVFRFDAVLHLGCRPLVTSPPEPGLAGAPAKAIARHIEAGGHPAVWRGLTNARLDGTSADSVDPESLWALDGLGGWKVRVGCEPGLGSGALQVWAGPPGAAGDHFGLSLPGGADPKALDQLPLPPGRMWSLLDTLKTHLSAELGEAEPADGKMPTIQLGPRFPGVTGQE